MQELVVGIMIFVAILALLFVFWKLIEKDTK